ncbi:hypothetical protein K439DRAFT_767408 [Ramaria rubella]|nr:hypothetical protein K439DRAFT_767408 [Ramaria rubella]
MRGSACSSSAAHIITQVFGQKYERRNNKEPCPRRCKTTHDEMLVAAELEGASDRRRKNKKFANSDLAQALICPCRSAPANIMKRTVANCLLIPHVSALYDMI